MGGGGITIGVEVYGDRGSITDGVVNIGSCMGGHEFNVNVKV